MFTKEQLEQFGSYDDYANKKFTPKQQAEVEAEAIRELTALKILRENVKAALEAYMAQQDIGIVELNKRFDTSSSQTNRILKGESNMTLATLAELSAKMGIVPKIVFEIPTPESNDLSQAIAKPRRAVKARAAAVSHDPKRHSTTKKVAAKKAGTKKSGSKKSKPQDAQLRRA